MVSFLILAISLTALIQFAVAQWRAIWISSANLAVSDALRSETGLDADTVQDTDFPKLIRLYNEVCPGKTTSAPWLKEIAHYYRAISALHEISQRFLPSISSWAGTEMRTCSRYVAVAIDHQLSINLDQLAAVRIS